MLFNINSTTKTCNICLKLYCICTCNFSNTPYDNTCVVIESTQEFLPFLYPSSYNVYTNVDDGSVLVTLPARLQFGGFHYDRAYVSKYNYT